MVVRLILLVSFLLRITVLCLNIPASPAILIDNENPLITNWTEEADIRTRQKEYAKEKFSHHYHFFQNFTENETKKVPKRQEIVRKKKEAITTASKLLLKNL